MRIKINLVEKGKLMEIEIGNQKQGESFIYIALQTDKTKFHSTIRVMM